MADLGLQNAFGGEAMAQQVRQRILDQLAAQHQQFQQGIESQKLDIERQRFAQEAADRAQLRQQQQTTFNEGVGEKAGANAGPGQTVMSPAEAAPILGAPSMRGLIKPDQTLPSTQITGSGQAPTTEITPGTQVAGTTPTITQQPSVLTGQLRFMGTPSANAAEAQRVKQTQLMNDPSLTPNKKLELQIENSGLKVPTGFNDKVAPIADAPYMLNGKPIVALKNQQGRIMYQGQDVTDHVTPYVAPKEAKDTSGRDENRLDKSYQFNSSQLEKIRTPISSKMDRLAGLNDALTQATPASDALVAPEILSIAAGGQGSGLRMNEAEISRIVGGRSVWENLKASLQKLSVDPAHANSLTTDQRNQIRLIMEATQTRGRQKISAIEKAEQGLVDAKDVNGHRQTLRDLQKELDTIDTTSPAGTTQTSGGVPSVGDSFQGGKVLKVEKVQ